MAIKVETPAGIPAPPPEKTFAMSRETENVKDDPISPYLKQRVLDSVPKSLKKKGEQVLRLMESAPSGSIQFNEWGELVREGAPLAGSHVVDLVNDMLRKRKIFTPIGWEGFAALLAELHPPTELVGNDDRWNYMQGAPFRSSKSGATGGGERSLSSYSEGEMYLLPSRKRAATWTSY